MENNIRIILAVAFDDANNQYIVDIPSGSSVPESAFAMSVVIKCLVRDGIVTDATEVTDLINKYLTDPQFEEVKDEQSENA